MSAQTIRSIRWECARCKVSVGRIDGGGSVIPDAWSRAEGLTYCLGCSRERAIDSAMASVPDTIAAVDRGRLRRRALISFEISRTPMAPDRVVAGACRTTGKAVAVVREELGLEPGALPSPGAGPY